MEREIKFRFWVEKAQKMSDWETAKKECDRLSLLSFDGFIPMQFTGIIDKNGVEIYEGDIVTFSTRRYHFGMDKGLQTIKWKSAVVWDEGGFMVSETQDKDTFICAHIDQYEVIGNICQNPELLTQAKI